jgi:hypothetical protein
MVYFTEIGKMEYGKMEILQENGKAELKCNLLRYKK